MKKLKRKFSCTFCFQETRPTSFPLSWSLYLKVKRSILPQNCFMFIFLYCSPVCQSLYLRNTKSSTFWVWEGVLAPITYASVGSFVGTAYLTNCTELIIRHLPYSRYLLLEGPKIFKIFKKFFPNINIISTHHAPVFSTDHLTLERWRIWTS